eukprot:m.307134 g.307134  ORF g.307134 m.307134 type:complete len:198 (+) comp41941_c0_seq1:1031-1624(+)
MDDIRPMVVVKDVADIAEGIGSIVKSGYKVAAAKEQLRQISKSKQILAMQLSNNTNYTWCLPKLYFAVGEADHAPPLTVFPGQVATWTAASHPLTNGLNAVLTYTLTDTKRLAIMFSISEGMFGKPSGWMGRIVDDSANLAASKNPAKSIYLQLNREKWNGADCSAYSRTFPGFEILGIMAHSGTPDLIIELNAINN